MALRFGQSRVQCGPSHRKQGLGGLGLSRLKKEVDLSVFGFLRLSNFLAPGLSTFPLGGIGRFCLDK